MRNARSITFIILVGVICFSPLFLRGLSTALPNCFAASPELTGNSQASTVTWEDVTKNPLKSYVWGKLAKFVDSTSTQTLENAAPFHDQLLLANASLQRIGIRTASLPTAYATVPSFYDSDYFIDYEKGYAGSITYRKADSDKTLAGSAELWASAVNEAAEQHEDIDFSYWQVYIGRLSPYKSTQQLVSGPTDHEYYKSLILEKLDSSILTFDDYFKSEEDFMTGWFSSDHHWKPSRALESYNSFALLKGWKQHEPTSDDCVCEKWYGSNARFSLDLSFPDSLYDDAAREGSLTWTVLENQGYLPEIFDSGSEGALYPDGSYNVYDKYYGYSDCEATNPDPDAQGTCLVICDSMAGPIRPQIASNYKRTVFILGDSSSKVKELISAGIEQYSPDDVVIIKSPYPL